MEVGKVFDTEKQVISYDHLGIARLIYQLPTTHPVLQKHSCAEVFKQDIGSLDSETLFTIQRFLRTTWNVSKPAAVCLCTATRWFTAWKRSRS